LAIASVMLLGVFAFPLWQIRLQAPQYPEGLGLNIKINTVESLHPHNIATINDLNHYIGMKAIRPDTVPALKIMPYLVALLIVMGLIVLIVNNRTLFFGWLSTFVALALAGFGDFYKWEYDYGHHLNPKAPIKVPGMSYQPPIIGSKQLLNIHATSIPGIGGILLGISLMIGVYILVNEVRSKKITNQKQTV